MNRGTRNWFIWLVSVAAALGIGAWSGGSLGYRAAVTSLATLSINTQVHSLAAQVDLLNTLREGDTRQATALAEDQMDRLIASLAPNRREGLELPAHTLSFIQQGLRTAKNYRTNNPRPTGEDTLIAADVAAALASVD